MTKEDLEGVQAKHCGKNSRTGAFKLSFPIIFLQTTILGWKNANDIQKPGRIFSSSACSPTADVCFWNESLAETRNGHLVIRVHVRVNDHRLWTSAPLCVLSRGRPVPGMTNILTTFPQQMDISENIFHGPLGKKWFHVEYGKTVRNQP